MAATRAVTLTESEDGSSIIATWTGLANGDDGTPINWLRYADRSVQFKGTFGAAGSIQLEWSNDGGTTWVIATDPQGNNIVKTAAGGEAITEFALLVRPHVTAGDGTTSLTAILAARRAS